MTSDKSKSFLFIVQGEGRGHLTQALALKALLTSQGHKVSHVLVGKSPQRSIPDFFIRNIDTPITFFKSPNYIRDPGERGIRLFQSMWFTLFWARSYLAQLGVIHKTVTQIQPDIIVNFFEIMAGLYRFLYRPKIPFACLGHQYVHLHPHFRHPPGHLTMRIASHLFVRLTSLGADKILALSFYPLVSVADQSLVVVPPLIRPRVNDLMSQRDGEYVLAYLLNSGYGNDLIQGSRSQPGIPVHCFWDKNGSPVKWPHDSQVTFHRLDDSAFLEMMSKCRAFLSTAGFESICEACYLEKPVFAVPVSDHYDQVINAFDLQENARLGLWGKRFQLDTALRRLDGFSADYDAFRDWVDRAKDVIVSELVSIARTSSSQRRDG